MTDGGIGAPVSGTCDRPSAAAWHGDLFSRAQTTSPPDEERGTCAVQWKTDGDGDDVVVTCGSKTYIIAGVAKLFIRQISTHRKLLISLLGSTYTKKKCFFLRSFITRSGIWLKASIQIKYIITLSNFLIVSDRRFGRPCCIRTLVIYVRHVLLRARPCIITKARGFMSLHVNLAKSYSMLDDIEIRFEVPRLNMWSFV